MKLALAIIFLALLAFDTYTAFACDQPVSSTDMNDPLTSQPQSTDKVISQVSDVFRTATAHTQQAPTTTN